MIGMNPRARISGDTTLTPRGGRQREFIVNRWCQMKVSSGCCSCKNSETHYVTHHFETQLSKARELSLLNFLSQPYRRDMSMSESSHYRVDARQLFNNLMTPSCCYYNNACKCKKKKHSKQ